VRKECDLDYQVIFQPVKEIDMWAPINTTSIIFADHLIFIESKVLNVL